MIRMMMIMDEKCIHMMQTLCRGVRLWLGMGEYCEHIWYSNSGEFEVANNCSTQITLCDSWKTCKSRLKIIVQIRFINDM